MVIFNADMLTDDIASRNQIIIGIGSNYDSTILSDDLGQTHPWAIRDRIYYTCV